MAQINITWIILRLRFETWILYKLFQCCKSIALLLVLLVVFIQNIALHSSSLISSSCRCGSVHSQTEKRDWPVVCGDQCHHYRVSCLLVCNAINTIRTCFGTGIHAIWQIKLINKKKFNKIHFIRQKLLTLSFGISVLITCFGVCLIAY